MDNDHDERIALFRYSVISEALDAGISAAERGLIVRALATRTWTTPVGEERSFSRGTICPWPMFSPRFWPPEVPAPRCDFQL
jgi:hypothetical protein